LESFSETLSNFLGLGSSSEPSPMTSLILTSTF
jgi:hypothetical protein